MSDSTGADIEQQTAVEEQTVLPVSAEGPPAPKLPLVEFESFSWSEEKYKVKIYIDMEDADKIADESIRFVSVWITHLFLRFSYVNVLLVLDQNWTDDSLDLRVDKNGKTYVFEIDALFDKVKEIQFKKKSSKFILTLIKARERIWYKLRF